MNIKPSTKVISLPIGWKVKGAQTRSKVATQSYVGNFTREQILAKAQQLSNKMKTLANGQISIAINYGGNEWRGGYFTQYGAPVQLHTFEDSGNDIRGDPDHFAGFAVYYVRNKEAAGGADDFNNDCLWNVLNLCIPKKNPWPTPAELKEFLKIKRDAKVEMHMLPWIDKKLPDSIKINVTGDYVYTSPKPSILEVNMKLVDGHFSWDKRDRKPVQGVRYTPAPAIFYEFIDNDCHTYDGKTRTVITAEKLKEHKRNFKLTMVRKDRTSKNGVVPTMEEQYATFMSNSAALQKATKGKLNLLKTGSVYTTALHFFDCVTRSITPQQIEQDEALWIQEASIGALIYSKPYSGEAWKGDFCSWYPSLMKKAGSLFPIKRGIFKIVEEPTTQFGIFRCIISKTTNPDISKLFRWNVNNKYTHRDVAWAKELRLDVSMIMDDHPNFLYYPRNHCVTGEQLFGDYVDTLFDLKQKKVPLAKDILNILWGALCQIDTIRLEVNNNDTTITELDDSATISCICPTGTGKTEIKFYKQEKVYTTNYARIMPFVLSFGRTGLAKFVQPWVKDIVYMHTDSAIISRKMKNTAPTASGLGEFKYEGYCEKFEITNCIKKTGTFIV